MLGGVLALIAALGFVSPAAANESYTVRRGDTLSQIAVRKGTTVAELVRANGLSNPDRIRVGQVLFIDAASDSSGPEKGSTEGITSSAAGQIYQVRSGDTLSEIAERWQVSTRALMELNEITSPRSLQAGATLRIPGGKGPGSAASSRSISAADPASGSEVGPTRPAAHSYPMMPGSLLADPGRMALVGTFEHWAGANGIPVDLLMAVAWNESGWQQDSLSHKGAVGVGQLMPDTSEWIASDLIGHPGLNPYSSEDNIRMSARYLDWLLETFDSEELAIAAYYQGQGAVKKGVIYADTETYVANVLALRANFRSA